MLRIAGSQDVKRPSGTGLSGCFSFLAFFQAAKLVKAHLVLLFVLAGTTPLERTASSSSLTKVEKRSLGRVELVRVRMELGEGLAEIGWILSVAGVVSIESPGQSVHSHIPRQNFEKDRPFKSLNCN